MPTWPAKTNYATGDVLTAAQMQDIGNALNSVGSAQYAAGKNAIINGDYRINQRLFSSTTTSATYGFDRWTTFIAGDGTCTYSAQTFTAGTAPVVGYEAINFARLLTASQTTSAVASRLEQSIEDVRTFANQTITISFWAKAASGTPKIAVEMTQGFGSGGSTSVNTYAGQVTLSTSWARYSVTVAIPSISGKTIGTGSALITRLYVSAGSDFNARTGSLGIQNNTFDIWGVQVESGSTATPFQTATGSLEGELAACQRYYEKSYDQATALGTSTNTGASAGTRASGGWATPIRFAVTKRSTPTVTVYSTATGTSARIRNRDAGSDEVASASDIGQTGLPNVSGTGGTAGVLYTWQWEASAEL